MSTEFIEFTIDDFYQKEIYNQINYLIHNEIYYYDISNFRKIKIQKHGKYKIFFDYIKNNKKDFKTLGLHKKIYVKKKSLFSQ